ncbi:MAG: M64 family metallopeptidase [Bacteroidota bacterium]
MKYKALFISLSLVLGIWVLQACASDNFSTKFEDKTMRFDFFHTGTATEEHFSFDQIVCDGQWAGSKSQLIDELRLGKYFFEVQDANSGEVLYSRGFASIYGEWETTPEAKENWGVYHESMRFPWPKADAKIVVFKRDSKHEFQPIWEYPLKADSWRAVPAAKNNIYKTVPIVENGDPHTKVDIVVLSEGYTKHEMDKFRKDAAKFAETLLNNEPFKSRKQDFNIRAVEVPAPENGVTHPHQDIHKRSALSVRYGAFNSQRYALGFDNKTIRDAAAHVPYEYTAILMNDSIYGGGGIYNLYITAAVDNAFQEYLFVHEFGHHFADLADEYYSSATAYEMGSTVVEPWELNVTANPDRETIKWKELLTEGVPMPTPWNQEAFDKHSNAVQKKRQEMRAAKAKESEMEELFINQREWEENFLSNIPHADAVGAFEGAQYHSKGIYRSAPNCIMFTRTDEFCPACQRAINLVIDQYTK